MQPPDTLPPSWQAADQEWTVWADDNQWKSRIGAFAMLLAGFVFLHFAGTIRTVLGTAETTVRGSPQLARVAFAGALIGIAGMTAAIVMIAAASSEDADADPVVSRAVTTASAGPFLVAAMGFAALLMAAGLLTLRSGVFARWVGIVALLGAISFLITFLTLIAGTGEDSVFGFGFFPGVVALVIGRSSRALRDTARSRRAACSRTTPAPKTRLPSVASTSLCGFPKPELSRSGPLPPQPGAMRSSGTALTATGCNCGAP
jgi:hypothetical protein